MKNIMFGDKKKLTDTERSLISETVSIEVLLIVLALLT